MKAWKVAQVVGVLMLLVGVFVRVGTDQIWGTALLALGAIVYAVARVATWLGSDKP